MNVLYTVLSADLSGGQKICLSMVKHLKQSGHSVVVVMPDCGPVASILEKMQVEAEFVRLNKLYYLPSVLKLARLIKAKEIQLVHTHDALPGTVLARIAGLITKTPVISHMHSIQDSTYFSKNKIKAFIARQADNLTSNISHTTLVASNAVKENLVQQGVRRDKIKVIPYGVDLDFDKELAGLRGVPSLDSVSIDGLDTSKKIVGIFARLTPSKGLNEFVRSVPIIRQEFPDVRFLIVGGDIHSGGEYEKELKAFVRDLREENAIQFVGFRFDVVELLKKIDILTVPSLSSEGSPLIIYEAFLCGKPVVATTVGGIPEQIDDGVTGILVTPGNEKELSEAILGLLRDEKKLEVMGRTAKIKAQQDFSQARMVKEIYALYCEILKTKKQY